MWTTVATSSPFRILRCSTTPDSNRGFGRQTLSTNSKKGVPVPGQQDKTLQSRFVTYSTTPDSNRGFGRQTLSTNSKKGVPVPGQQDKTLQSRTSTAKQSDVAPTQAPRLGTTERGSKNVEFEERLEAVRRLTLEKKKVDDKKIYGPIDYDAPVEPKQKTVGLGAKVGLGVAIIVFGLVFALGDFLPSGSVTGEQRQLLICRRNREGSCRLDCNNLRQHLFHPQEIVLLLKVQQ